MKTTMKLFEATRRVAIIALVAIIGIVLAACDNEADPPHVHQWGEWAITAPATCSTEGVETRACALDAEHFETRSVEINTDAHDYGEWMQTQAPSETAEGEETRTCANESSHVERRSLAALNHVHQWGEWRITSDPSCTIAGVEMRACALNANHKETRAGAAALGHDWGEWTQTRAPNCISAAVETATCTRDGRTGTRAGAQALGHDWGTWTQINAPTCITTGVEAATCSRDGRTEYRAGAPINPQAHSWRAWTVITAPTATETGEEKRVCFFEASHTETRIVPVLPHEHQWGAWTQIKAPTATEAGEETRTCALDSSHTQTRSIPATGGGGVVTPPAGTAPTITTTTLAGGTVGTAYNQTLAASGTTPITWSVDSGSLPGGLTLSSNVISGTPTVAETFTFTVKATNSAGNVTKSFSIEIFYTANSVADLKTWLASQPANSPSTPYNVKLNVNDISGLRDALGNAAGDRYVIIDLSGSTITSIPNQTFYGSADPYGTRALVGITLPGTVSSIEDNAFGFSTRLVSVTIPQGVTTIKSNAFNNTGLSSVNIPASVTSIEGAVFSNCDNLSAINVDAGNTAYTSISGVLFNKAGTTLVQYPKGKGASYAIPNSVTIIGDGAFKGCDGLSSVTIPSGVTKIENSAFSVCSGLGSITIPNTVTIIEAMAFQSTGLSSVIIPGSVSNIGTYAFNGCNSLLSVTFEGQISSGNFSSSNPNPFPGDLKAKFYATDSSNGTPGTYTRSGFGSTTWTLET